MTPQLTRIIALLEHASTDELDLAEFKVNRIMSRGRDSYGPMHLANDGRDFLAEGLDELDDLESYLWMHRRREQLQAQAFPDAAEFCDEEETGERFDTSDVEVGR